MIFFKKTIRYLVILLFVLGVFLFFLDSMRFFYPLRNDEINNKKLRFPNDIQLTAEESFKRIDDAKNLPDKQYAIEINNIVHNGIAHSWSDEKKYDYRIQIPIFRNYIIYLLSKLKPSIYDKYEFCDYRRAIQRGIGLCSQHALAMTDILSKRNIASYLIGLDGHVVVVANVDQKKNEWWTFDPDYGIVIDKSLEEIKKKPEIIRDYYLKKGIKSEIIDALIEIYRKGAKSEYINSNCRIEKLSYILIWIIPIVFVFPYILILIKTNFNK